MNNIIILSLILLAISVFITADLALNFFANSVPAMNDGLMCTSIFKPFFNDNWSIQIFYNYFVVSLWVTVAIFIANIGLYILGTKTKIN